MQIKIIPLNDSPELLVPLAKVYRRSYNQLSYLYKSPKEMALYTHDVFVGKLQRFAQDKESFTGVLMVDGEPKGFTRISRLPEYYKHPQDGVAAEKECGEMDGYAYGWQRKIRFNSDTKLDDQTLIINQIYLDPSIQRQRIGTYLMQNMLPKLKKEGFHSVILEYNAHNLNAEKFYRKMGFEPIAESADFDNIIKKDGKTKLCISPVKIAHTTIDHALQSIRNQQKAQIAMLVSALGRHAANKQK